MFNLTLAIVVRVMFGMVSFRLNALVSAWRGRRYFRLLQMFRGPFLALFLMTAMTIVAAEPRTESEYTLIVSPREDSFQKDAETGADLLFLTKAESKDTHLYFHQRSWLADSSLILFNSSRKQGGLMGYMVETGELARITAADGSSLRSPTAAVNRNSVLAMAGDRVLEIQITVAVQGTAGHRHAKVVARERPICTAPRVDH